MSTTRLYYVTVGTHGATSADGLDAWSSSSPPARCSVSSYDTLEHFTDKHAAELEPGAPVVDLRPLADHPRIMRLAFDAPMVDPTLGADEIDRWPGADELGLAPFLAANYFGAAGLRAAITQTTDAPGAFDHVSPRRLAAYWHALGARVGVWTGAAIEWADTAAPLELEPAPQLF